MVLSLVPAAAMALTLLDRNGRGGSDGPPRPDPDPRRRLGEPRAELVRWSTRATSIVAGTPWAPSQARPAGGPVAPG